MSTDLALVPSPDLMDTSVPVEGERRQCKARSKQSGVRCKRRPIPGGTVCVLHGGGAPAVKAKAERRLAALVDPALGALGEMVRVKEISATRLNAAKDILDRNNIGKSQEESKPNVQVNVAVALSQLTDAQLEALHALAQAMKAQQTEGVGE